MSLLICCISRCQKSLHDFRRHAPGARGLDLHYYVSSVVRLLVQWRCGLVAVVGPSLSSSICSAGSSAARSVFRSLAPGDAHVVL